MVQMGTYSELLSSSASFARLLEDINQHQQEQEQKQEQKQDQKQQTPILLSRHSMIGSICTEIGDEEELEPFLADTETKQEGTVKWNVYISYLGAGIGVILGVILILTVFTAQQAVHLYSNRWLAEWSDDESHRFRVNNNCTNVFTQKIGKIRSMSGTEWNKHRDERFYWLSSKLIYYI